MQNSYIKINTLEYPPKEGESWWVVHPNSGVTDFVIPEGAVTACTKDFMDFKTGVIYKVQKSDFVGWICVLVVDKLEDPAKYKEIVVDMPEYIFARYFDAEIFVRGRKKVYNILPSNYNPDYTFFDQVSSKRAKGFISTVVPRKYNPNLDIEG